MISSQTHWVSTAGNGSTTVFTIPFVFFANADVKVYKFDTLLGGNVLQTLTTHYTQTGVANPAGGSITMVTAPLATDIIVIVRNVSVLQATDYINNDAFDSEAHERQMDLIVQMIQNARDPLDTTGHYPLRFPVCEPTANAKTLPTHTLRKGKLLYFNATTGAMEVLDLTTLKAALAALP